MEISASSGLVSDLAEAFEKDRGLCAELDSFVVDESTEIGMEGDNKSNIAAKFEQESGSSYGKTPIQHVDLLSNMPDFQRFTSDYLLFPKQRQKSHSAYKIL
jgi:hypothetical protein